MTTVPLCSCGQPCPAAFLCRACTGRLAAALALAASLAPDLEDAAAKLVTRGSSGVRAASPEPPLPYDPRAAMVRDRLYAVLAVAAEEVAGRVTATISGAAITLTRHLDGFRQDPRAQGRYAAITEAVADAVTVVDSRPERAPAGLCEGCGSQLLAELGADEVRCRCGVLTAGLRERRTQRAAAADVLGTPRELAGLLAQLGYRTAESTISAWGTRGRIEKRAGGMYRLSDVLAMAAQRTGRAS